MSILNSGIVPVGSTGYDIDNSLRFNDNDSARLTRTPSVAGNRKTWTWSGWVKRGNLGAIQTIFSGGTLGSAPVLVNFNDATYGIQDSIWISVDHPTQYVAVNTTRVFRDVGAWYHIVFVLDTTQVVATNRIKLYVNGELIPSSDFTHHWTSAWTQLVQNSDREFNSTLPHSIGGRVDSTRYLDGYIAEVNFVDGQALTPSDFGETDETYGHWKAKAYTGTYGTNGFYLDFKDSGSLGNDANGSNNWTPNNLAATDQMLDSPTNNFCTWNPLAVSPGVVGRQAEGNLFADNIGTSGNWSGDTLSTISVDSGKWYHEIDATGFSTYTSAMIGWCYADIPVTTDGSVNWANNIGAFKIRNDSVSHGCYGFGAYTNFSSTRFTDGIITLAIDFDAGKCWIAKNNVWYTGNPSTGTAPAFTFTPNGRYTPYLGLGRQDVGTTNMWANFGADSSFAGRRTAGGNADGNGIGDFFYEPPTGFLALCTQNLPEPTVVPSEHFNTVLYTGTGGTQSITGVGFQPDFTWNKQRSAGDYHALQNSVAGPTKILVSNNADAERTITDCLTAFTSTGFTLGADSSGFGNESGHTYASWNWKANGAGVTNNDGSIASTVSANVDAGFSIVSYTGASSSSLETIGHGLAQKPELYIVKRRNSAALWLVRIWDASISSYRCGILDESGAIGTAQNDHSGFYMEADSTNLKYHLESVSWSGGVPRAFGSGDTYIAYAFHSVEGYSKVGSYTGNGSTDGTFVHCGFRPAYVMSKRTDAGGSWVTHDTVRNTSNPANLNLYPNLSASEELQATYQFDMLSNGFKVRGTHAEVNISGGTYIFLAFAEHPFKYSTAK